MTWCPATTRGDRANELAFPRIRPTVIGTGYLGLTHAVCMAELGHDVLAIDVDTSAWSADRLREVYAMPLCNGTPCLVMDLETAELVKVAASAFLATKISFINAMAEVCEAAGADVIRLAAALAHDERIGGRFLSPGLGFGGGCLPILGRP